MSLSENPPGDTPIKPAEDKGESNTVELLRTEVRSLRMLFNIVVFALIVLMVGLCSFMLRERKLVRQKIDESYRYVAEYKLKMEPRVNELHSKLFAYSKLHTNFFPIYVKYFGATNLPPGLSATSS